MKTHGTPANGPHIFRRFRPLAAIASALFVGGVVIWFARPQELIWWTSPAIGKTGLHLRMLIPNGWEVEPNWRNGKHLGPLPITSYAISPSERKPIFVRWLVPTQNDGTLGVSIPDAPTGTNVWGTEMTKVVRNKDFCWASHVAMLKTAGLAIQLDYYRYHRRTFDRTYKQICDSLKIE